MARVKLTGREGKVPTSSHVSNGRSTRSMDKLPGSSEDTADLDESPAILAHESDDLATSAAVTTSKPKSRNSGRKRKDIESSEDEYAPKKKETPTKKIKGVSTKSTPSSKTPQSGKATSSVRFRGQSSNGREVGRHLVFWTENTKDVLLLMIQFHLAQEGVTIPWDEIAHAMFPDKGTSGQAIIQQLSKMRGKIWKRGGFAPPLPGRATDRKITKKREISNIRGYVGIKGRGGVSRAVAWNEDCSMMYEDKDIDERRLKKIGPVTIEGMPNKKIGSDDRAEPDLDPKYTSDYDDEDFDSTPVTKKKAAIRKHSVRKLLFDDEDTDDSIDGGEAIESDDSPTKRKVTLKMALIGKTRAMKSTTGETSSPEASPEPEATSNIMTFHDEDDMKYDSDEDVVGSATNTDQEKKKLIIRMLFTPSKLEAISKKNNEYSCENFPANYFLDKDIKQDVTEVAPGDMNFVSSWEDEAEEGARDDPDETQSQGSDAEDQVMEHLDAHCADTMHPGSMDRNTTSFHQVEEDLFHVNEDGKAIDKAGNQHHAMIDNAGTAYMVNDDGTLTNIKGTQFILDNSGNLFVIAKGQVDPFESLQNSQSETHSTCNAASSKENTGQGDGDLTAHQPGNDGSITFSRGDNEFAGITYGDVVADGDLERPVGKEDLPLEVAEQPTKL